jgi:hypothetical protein
VNISSIEFYQKIFICLDGLKCGQADERKLPIDQSFMRMDARESLSPSEIESTGASVIRGTVYEDQAAVWLARGYDDGGSKDL